MQYEFKCNKCGAKLEIYCKYDNLKDELKKNQPCNCGGDFKRIYGCDIQTRLGVKELNRRSIVKNEMILDKVFN